MRKKFLAAGLFLLCAALLSSCGMAPDEITENTAGHGEGLISDTHQTEYGTESGTETEEPDDSMVVDMTGDDAETEDSQVIQESVTEGQSEASAVRQMKTDSSGENTSSSAKTQGQSETSEGVSAAGSTDESSQAQPETGAGQPESSQNQSETEGTVSQTENAGGPFTDMMASVQEREASGEKWALAYEDLSDGSQYGYRESEKMQSASVIKLFIMGTVYRYMCYPEKEDELINFGESYDGELRDTINSMITVSDNDAANLLVERLGKGDFAAGAKLVNQFCQDEGYTQTFLGRRFMASDLSTGDNYTSAADLRKFYSDIYHGKLINEDASAKMLEIVKAQTRKNKIPSGLPEGFTSGNKTGEMPDGYGLGCIENDSAIIFPPEDTGKEGYILIVLSNDLAGRNGEAQSFISQISADAAKWFLNQTQTGTQAAQTGTQAAQTDIQAAQTGTQAAQTDTQAAQTDAQTEQPQNGNQ